MKSQIEVFQVGSPVIIGDHIEATILTICIYNQLRITYQVAWWDGNTRKSEWLEEDEVKSHRGEVTMRVGFKEIAL